MTTEGLVLAAVAYGKSIDISPLELGTPTAPVGNVTDVLVIVAIDLAAIVPPARANTTLPDINHVPALNVMLVISVTVAVEIEAETDTKDETIDRLGAAHAPSPLRNVVALAFAPPYILFVVTVKDVPPVYDERIDDDKVESKYLPVTPTAFSRMV